MSARRDEYASQAEPDGRSRLFTSALSRSEVVEAAPQADKGSHRRSALHRLEPVQRQILCRSINEAIYRVSDSFGFEGEIELVCECMRPSCFDGIVGKGVEYEHVRRFPTRFLIKRGHLDPTNERIVHETDRFVVIEKFGPQAEVVIVRDPRRTPDKPPDDE